MEYVIEVADLKKSFGTKNVLTGINLKVTKGESVVIIGGSGSGKSVLFKCILGLINPTSGLVKINNHDVSTLSRSELQKTRLKCGVLFQGGALFDSLTVIENVSFGLIYGLRMPRNKAFAIALEKLKSVNLEPDVANLYPAELSGGMIKRVALARAIATNPDIIFFDEPTSGLDPITSKVINNLIIKCTKEFNISAITITHDINSLKTISDYVYLLHNGKFIWEGKSKDIWNSSDTVVSQFVN